jgi:hypothetical protein
MAQAKITHMIADSVTVDGDVVTTVVVALDDGRIYFTDATNGAEWHSLARLPDE